MTEYSALAKKHLWNTHENADGRSLGKECGNSRPKSAPLTRCVTQQRTTPSCNNTFSSSADLDVAHKRKSKENVQNVPFRPCLLSDG